MFVRLVRCSVLTVVGALVALTALLPGAADAGSAPANDDFPGTAITALPYELTLDTSEATAEVDEPVSYCSFYPTNTVWWQFEATETQLLIAAAKGETHPPVLAIWEESAFGGGGLVELNCAGDPGFPGIPDEPDFPGYPPALEISAAFQAEAGQSYFIQIGGYDESYFPFGAAGVTYPPGGALTFSVTAPVPPANDDFASAQQITDLPFSEEVSTVAATKEPDEPRSQCFPSSDQTIYPDSTVWYSFSPASNIEVLINTLASDFFPFMAVWTGVPGNLTEVTCNFDALAFEAAMGTTYYIQVGSVAFEDFPTMGGMVHIIIDEYDRPVCSAVTQSWPDPPGDTLGALPHQPDFVGMSVAVGPDAVCITLAFDELELGIGDDVDYVFGYIDLDLDQNANTGSTSPEEPCLPAGRMGYEAFVPFESSGISTVMPIYLTGVLPQGGGYFPMAGISYGDNSITLAIPIGILGDANFDLIAEVANSDEITDCAPNDGVASVIQPGPRAFADVNCDGQLNTQDVSNILSYRAGIYAAPTGDCEGVGEEMSAVYPVSGSPLISGDLNCDAVIDGRDALLLLMYIAEAGGGSAGCPDPDAPPVQ